MRCTLRPSSRPPSAPPAAVVAVLLPALLAMLLAGCAGRDQPAPLPPQTTTTVRPELEPPPPDLPPPIRSLPPTKRETLKVIDPGGGSGEPTTLVEASRLARRQKQQQPPTSVEITDDNLHEYAAGASLVIAADASAAPAATMPPPAEGSPSREAATGEEEQERAELDEGPLALGDLPAGGEALGEDYWRDRALELRMGWRRTVDEVAQLELETAALRQQFYAEDDQHFRDGQIKPQWDRALDRLDRLRERALTYEEQLEILVEEGRRNGVPQGWLNEGWELEPSRDEIDHVRRIGAHEPEDVEPAVEARDVEVVDEDAGQDGR